MNKLNLTLILALLLSTVSAGYFSPAIKNTVSAIPAIIDVENATSDSVAAQKITQENAYFNPFKQVIINESPFLNERNERISLFDYYDCSNFDELANEVMIAVVDMDGDGSTEVVFKNEKGYSLVLRNNGKNMQAYEFTNREMSFLKNDGTFIRSKDVGDNGYATLIFMGNGYDVLHKAAFKPSDEEPNSFSFIRTINDEVVTLEEFREFIVSQEEKKLNWFELTVDNINSLYALNDMAELTVEIENDISDIDTAVDALENVLNLVTPFYSDYYGFNYLDDYYAHEFNYVYQYNIFHEFNYDDISLNSGMRIVDIDNDTVPEIVLSWFIDSIDLLRYYNGQVYSYGFSNRQMNNLKADGTYSWAGTAARHGVGKVRFDKDIMEIERIAEVDAVDNEITGEIFTIYKINGLEVTADEYSAYIAAQEQKEDARGFKFTEENISNIKNLFYNIPLDFQ